MTDRPGDGTAASDQATRVAVITGGSGGIGRVTAKRLAADGLAMWSTMRAVRLPPTMSSQSSPAQVVRPSR
jgi:NADP-dependent 3-hydroxy acid dehydrogenase YdfG